MVLDSVYQAFTRKRRGEPYGEKIFAQLLADRGLLARIFHPMFKLIIRSWHRYPRGVLFGSGFDTATEIGLLGISAAEASRGVSVWSILVFPPSSAPVCLVDTTDSILMLGAYGWVFIKPMREL